jgi:hypothetical protein
VKSLVVIEFPGASAQDHDMRHLLSPLLIALALGVLLPSAAAAECYVEYKAKNDNPLRLHYGIVALQGPCPDSGSATQQAARRVASGGWTLLNVVGLSETTPSGNKRANAGDYYLRF